MQIDDGLSTEIQERSRAAFEIVAMAASTGGLTALSQVLSGLPKDFPAPIAVVQHLDPRHRSLMAEILGKRTALEVRQAREGDDLRPGWVYIAPPDHHLLINGDGTLSLSRSELVHFVRPSADLLFDSMAASCGRRAIAVVLTGSGSDGEMGFRAAKEKRGHGHSPERKVGRVLWYAGGCYCDLERRLSWLWKRLPRP